MSHYPAIMLMVPASLLTALATLSTTAFAQTEQVTWAAVTFTYHGEKTPDLHSAPYDLTPLGAQQLYNAGQIVRDRYISPPANGSELTTGSPIQDISVDVIDNSQLYILSMDDAYLSASTMAFMQGLYPPSSALEIDEQSILANGSLAQ